MADEPGRQQVRIIGSDGQLHVVEQSAPAKPQSAAKMVADKLHVKYEDDADNGELRAKDAGRIGGNLGGPMVSKLVALARQEMANQHVASLIEATKK
ncbi:small, acid-soluble spore protein, alpha/beta type [Alicyclobacillus acidoterrestris]|uniref:Small, acid-soluble spore protein, alpha/beta type n=1 Tax=Alicyclobacillus acidoterrestris (strain ATCC 49025 / DSM 3922 / CIP 106132 / NCIMB 13137 / GD3B) TaxID=1356854 RepID=T0BJZ3_ALIAG|nr:small, acid-soluble spore protein, alpha/beta type [Alicyclobacillus acidoterrestris]EPZ44318.1 hypothetical protein N007_11095 [Alicyclobacillus acidoterrestris ATCC 49025]UNO47918.1 small, acid-soluble spore protein, alpha/beta type [Alicyclobacillus acidoterrestris]